MTSMAELPRPRLLMVGMSNLDHIWRVDTFPPTSSRTHASAYRVLGSGKVLGELGALGIRRVTDILMTHHHRDQGQGLARAVAAGLRIWVPHMEQDLFREVDEHWQAREIYNSYNNRQDRLSLLEPVPIDGTLKHYEQRRFGAYSLTVVPTPGHTTGSISLLVEIDGQRVAFSGDLIAAPGKLWSLAATQWSYNGAEGVAASIASLLDLRDRSPDLLLPSHGEAMKEPEAAIDALVPRLAELLRHRGQNLRLFSLREQPYEVVTPHLLANRTSLSNSYVLLSASNKALLIDFGYDFVTGSAAGADRASRRPWLYTLPVLKRDSGVEKIDVVMPTHHHDDHVAGFNLLRDVEGTEVWAADNFANILERPADYNLPCLWYDPIPVDRVLPLREPVPWQEYQFTLYEQPGHTRFAVAIAFEVDGKRVLAVGDQYESGKEAEWNYVYNNGFRLDDYQKSAELYRRLAPDLILFGHSAPYWVEPDYYQKLEQRGDTLSRLHHELLPLDEVHFDTADVGMSIRPYQVLLGPGEEAGLVVEVRNPFPNADTATVRLVAPAGWRVEPNAVTLELVAHASGRACFKVAPLPQWVRRARIAADLTVGDRHFGQQAEALVSVG